MATASYTKNVNISTDNATWKILPVNSVSINTNSGLQDNTNLSNNAGFRSRIYGINDFSVSLEGDFVPYTTYQFDIKTSGTSTAFATEAMTNTVGDTWQIDDTAKRIFDRDASFTFYDNAIAIPAGDIQSIDYLNGTVTFTATKTGPITSDGNYIPVAQTLCVSEGSFTLTQDLQESQNIKTVNLDGGFKSRTPKLRDFSISTTSFNDLNKTFFDKLKAGETVVVEISLGSAPDTQIVRAWCVIESVNTSGGVDDLENLEVSFQLEGDALSSVSWVYPGSGFNEGLQILTNQFFFGGDIYIQELPEGITANGRSGKVELESFTVNFDINGKVTFSSSLQGDGELVDAT